MQMVQAFNLSETVWALEPLEALRDGAEGTSPD